MTIKHTVTIQETVDFLNEVLKIDPVALTALFSLRIPCNKDLADHETVQVGSLSKTFWQVGMIGILNGLFGIDEYKWGHISADYYDGGQIIKFRVLTSEEIKNIIEIKKEI